MKQKHIGKILKIGIFLGLLTIELLGLGFNQITHAATVPDVISDKQSVNLGDSIQLTIRNAPANSTAAYLVNGVLKPMSMIFTLAVTTDNGFRANSDNTITVSLKNSAGASVPLKDNGSLTITVKTPPAGTGMSSNASDHLYNPISGYDNITQLIINVMKGFMAIIAVWAVAFIIIGGFRMVISQGNEEAVTAAKKTILWAVMGVVVALLSFAIIAVVQNFIGIDVQPATTTYNVTVSKV